MKLFKRRVWRIGYKKVNAIQAVDAENLVKKPDYGTKIRETEKEITDNDHNNKYNTTQELNKLTSENFSARLKQANLTNNANIADFVKKTDFDNKLKKLIKTVSSNKVKTCRGLKKLIDLANKVAQISEKGYYFLFGRMFFTGNDDNQSFWVFIPISSSLIMDSNEKVTNCILTGIPSKKIKPFVTNLEATMSNLANVTVILKFNISVLV